MVPVVQDDEVAVLAEVESRDEKVNRGVLCGNREVGIHWEPPQPFVRLHKPKTTPDHSSCSPRSSTIHLKDHDLLTFFETSLCLSGFADVASAEQSPYC